MLREILLLPNWHEGLLSWVTHHSRILPPFPFCSSLDEGFKTRRVKLLVKIPVRRHVMGLLSRQEIHEGTRTRKRCNPGSEDLAVSSGEALDYRRVEKVRAFSS